MRATWLVFAMYKPQVSLVCLVVLKMSMLGRSWDDSKIRLQPCH